MTLELDMIDWPFRKEPNTNKAKFILPIAANKLSFKLKLSCHILVLLYLPKFTFTISKIAQTIRSQIQGFPGYFAIKHVPQPDSSVPGS